MEQDKIVVIPHGTDLNCENIKSISDNEFAYGIWLFELNKKDQLLFKGLYRDGIISNLTTMGYYKRYRDNNSYIFIKELDNIIWEVEPSIMKDEFFGTALNKIEFEYVGHKVNIQSEKLRETYLNQHHLFFNHKFLEHLSTHIKPILKDTKDEAYFFFQNQIVKVTATGIIALEYSTIKDQCIWRNQKIDHDFKQITETEDCHFVRFIKNVCNSEQDRTTALISVTGYLLHNYSNPSGGQAVILYDEEITDLKKPMGGTGKGLLANAIKEMRNVAKVDGKRFDSKDKFRYQEVTESTQIFWLDDAKPELGFEVFHSILTDGMNVEHKYKTTFFIKPEESPKVLISCNAILNGDGTTNKRRQFIIEFSNHYSKKIKKGHEQPIISEHGCMFFSKTDWDADEWNKFFSFMLKCVQNYLNNGLQTYEYRGLNKNRLMQSTSEDFCKWVEEQNFEVGKQYETKEMFENFIGTYSLADSDFKQRGFTNWMKEYAKSKDWDFKAKTSNHIQFFSFQQLSS